MSNKYNNGKIYKLVCENGYYYIGSTIQKLNLRFNHHKDIAKTSTLRVYKHINNIGWDKVYIKLIDNYPCNNKNELNRKEIEYIDTNDYLCLNNDTDETDLEMETEQELELDIELENKYQNGKIYKLQSIEGYYYIGSTTKTLQERFSSHKYCIENDIDYRNSKNYRYFKSIPIDEIDIELIEDYPCSSKKELREREDHYIILSLSDKYCLNTFRAFQTDEEKKEYYRLYYALHKDKAQEYMKKYYEEHKEEIIENHREYNELNREKVDAYHVQYRLDNAEKRREYTRQYALNHPEQIKEANKKYNEENKEKLAEYWKEYAKRDENKDRIRENKRRSALKIKEQNADKIAKEREEKKKTREEQKHARIAHDRKIVQCSCGGSYQTYKKKRHEENKKHQKYLASICI